MRYSPFQWQSLSQVSATTPISHSDDADLLASPRGLRLLFWPLLVVYNRFLCSLVVSPSQVSLYLSPVLLLPLPPCISPSSPSPSASPCFPHHHIHLCISHLPF